MKKETFSKRKIGKQLVSVMMLGLAVSPIVLQSSRVFADDKTKIESVVTDSSKQLSDLIGKAKGLGVEIKQSEKKTFQSKAELDAFLKDQIAKLNQAISEAEKLKAENAKIDAANKKAQTDYDAAYKKYQADKAEYDKKLKSWTEGLAKFQKDQQDLTKRNDILSSKDGIVVYGKYDEANKGSVKYYGQISVGLSDYNKYPNLSFVKDGDYIGYHDDSVITDVKVKKAEYNKTNSGDRTWLNANDFAKGDSFKLTNVATTTDGAKIDMIVTFRENFNPILTEPGVNDTKFGNFGISKYGKDGAMNIDNRNSDHSDLDFKFVDQKTGKPVELLTANVESDLDDYQSSLLEYSTTKSAITLIPQGSESELQGGAVVSKFGGNVDNTNSIPKGSFVSVGIGDTIRHQFKSNTKLDNATRAKKFLELWKNFKATGDILEYLKSGYTYQLFGKSASVNLNVFKEKKPVEPKEPEKPKVTNAASKAPSVEISEVSMVITKHVDIVTGKELTPQEEGTKPKRAFDGYEFVETKTIDGNTVHFYKPIDKTPIKPIKDKPKEDKSITKHYDITTGKEIAPQQDGNQPKKDIPNYEFVETKTKTGETDHYYKPAAKPITRHIDKETGKELTPPEDGNKPKKDIPGYRFVETKDKDGNTIHYYEKVITKHLDIDTGKEIADREDGQKSKKTIDGYEFVETKDENGDTIHYYKQVKKVSTHYVDKDGKELEKSVEGVQDKKEIKGYKFVTTRKLQNGDIEHVYEKVAAPAATSKGDTPKTFAKTGESNSLILTSLGLVFAGVLGFLGFKKYRSSKETTN